jgi:type I restriction enzyme S subunit
VKLAEDQVYYLQERRSALISAAVTGKIDVRGWQTEPEATPMAAGTLPHTHDRVS